MNFSTKWDIFVIIFQSMVSKTKTWREKKVQKGGEIIPTQVVEEKSKTSSASARERERGQPKCWRHQEEQTQ